MDQSRVVKLEVFGGTYHLLFNGEAMFELSSQGQKFDPISFVNCLAGAAPDSFDALCTAVCVLSEKGELARRDWGYDRGEILTAEKARRDIMPYDILEIRDAVIQAVQNGLFREVPSLDNSERDVGLEKLNKKKGETT